MKKHVLRRLARFLRPYAPWLIACVVLTAASNLLSLAAPLLSGRAVDAVGVSGGVDFPGYFSTAEGCWPVMACPLS